MIEENKTPLSERDGVEFREIIKMGGSYTINLPNEIVVDEGIITGHWEQLNDGRWVFVKDYGDKKQSQKVYDNNRISVPESARDGTDGFFVWVDDDTSMITLQEALIVAKDGDEL